MVDVTAITKTADSPAGSTILKVIGAMLPDAVVEPFRERIVAREARNKRDAAVADAVAKQMAADDSVVSRARARLEQNAYKYQENLEAVASVAIELGALDNSENDDVPDDDWINLFNSHAEKASSAKMRDLFGRILAGEIRKPASFSPATMRVVAELDQETAQDLQFLSGIAWGDSIYIDSILGRGENLIKLERLATYGFINGQDMVATASLGDNGRFHLLNGLHAIELIGQTQAGIKFTYRSLTKVGLQLISIIAQDEVGGKALRVAQALKNSGIQFEKAMLRNYEDGKVSGGFLLNL